MKKSRQLNLIFNMLLMSNVVWATNESLPPNPHTQASSLSADKKNTDDSSLKVIQAYEISALQSSITEQKEKNINFQKKLDTIENSSGLNFAVWSGIILTSVAVLLTILGITIAVFSFFGYRKVMNSARDAAKQSSKIEASKVAERLAPKLTEQILLKLIEKGSFDKIIQQSIEKVTYRGIEFSSGDMLEDKDKNS